MLLTVFVQSVTQVYNEERSAVEAMHAKLKDLHNGCNQKYESAYKQCYVCSMNVCLVSYDITHTCLCNMRRFLKSVKWYF